MRVARYAPSPEGARLKNHRTARDITQRTLSELIGYSTAAVGLVETGHWRPTRAMIAKMAAALELTLAQEEEILALRATAWQRGHEVESIRLKVGVSNED